MTQDESDKLDDTFMAELEAVLDEPESPAIRALQKVIYSLGGRFGPRTKRAMARLEAAIAELARLREPRNRRFEAVLERWRAAYDEEEE